MECEGKKTNDPDRRFIAGGVASTQSVGLPRGGSLALQIGWYKGSQGKRNIGGKWPGSNLLRVGSEL